MPKQTAVVPLPQYKNEENEKGPNQLGFKRYIIDWIVFVYQSIRMEHRIDLHKVIRDRITDGNVCWTTDLEHFTQLHKHDLWSHPNTF